MFIGSQFRSQKISVSIKNFSYKLKIKWVSLLTTSLVRDDYAPHAQPGKKNIFKRAYMVNSFTPNHIGIEILRTKLCIDLDYGIISRDFCLRFMIIWQISEFFFLPCNENNELIITYWNCLTFGGMLLADIEFQVLYSFVEHIQMYIDDDQMMVDLDNLQFSYLCTVYFHWLICRLKITMVMLVELQATCSALGYQEGKKYVKEPDCLGKWKLNFSEQIGNTLFIARSSR